MCVAIPGAVVEVTGVGAQRVAMVAFGETIRSVSLLAVDAEPGDWVLTHSGFVVERLSEPAAQRMLSFLPTQPYQPDIRGCDE